MSLFALERLPASFCRRMLQRSSGRTDPLADRRSCGGSAYFVFDPADVESSRRWLSGRMHEPRPAAMNFMAPPCRCRQHTRGRNPKQDNGSAAAESSQPATVRRCRLKPHACISHSQLPDVRMRSLRQENVEGSGEGGARAAIRFD